MVLYDEVCISGYPSRKGGKNEKASFTANASTAYPESAGYGLSPKISITRC